MTTTAKKANCTWTVRNYAEFHRLLPVRDNFGFELWQGNHVGEPDTNEFNRLGEIGFMEAKRDAAVQFIRDDPQRFLHGCLFRFLHFWGDPNLRVWLPLSFLTWIGCAFAVRKKGWEAMRMASCNAWIPGQSNFRHAIRWPLGWQRFSIG